MNGDFYKIKEGLEALGVKKGDDILVHSSLGAMGYVDGGAKTFIEALLYLISDSGTIIVPTLTYSYVREDFPFYNHRETPSCVGIISEFVRNMEGAKRSIHPTHSCSAIGKRRDFYVAGHEMDKTPVGENSPFRRLGENGGKILMLGCGAGPNTTMHGIEEKFKVSYLLSEYPVEHYINENGKEYNRAYYRHRISQRGFAQRYERLLDVIPDEYAKKGEVHGAKSILFESDKVWEYGGKAIENDEHYFVERVIK